MLVRVPEHLYFKCQEEAGDHVKISTPGRDVEVRVVVLALRVPLERPGLSRLVQQAQWASPITMCACSLPVKRFEPSEWYDKDLAAWTRAGNLNLEVAVHRELPAFCEAGNSMDGHFLLSSKQRDPCRTSPRFKRLTGREHARIGLGLLHQTAQAWTFEGGT